MMNEFIIEEGNLEFNFTHCGKPERFDELKSSGLYAVDFFVDNEKYLLFIEVKDYQNPNTPRIQRNDDYNMLFNAGRAEESIFTIKMGGKIKDSLLSLYAKGGIFPKNVVYLLFINSDELKAAERQLLFERIYGQIPTGLNSDLYTAFKKIKFKLVDADDLKKYGVVCKSKNLVQEGKNS